MSGKYKMKKYIGDSVNDWAIFYAKDVEGIPDPIKKEVADPIKSGMRRKEAMQAKYDLMIGEENGGYGTGRGCTQ